MVGAVILLVLTVGSIGAPVSGAQRSVQGRHQRLPQGPAGAAPRSGRTPRARDVFSRLLYAGRVSLSVGLVAVTIYTVIGVILGAFSGFYGGWVDSLIMRLADIVLSFPSLILIITVVSVLGPSIYNIMLVIGLLGWPPIARIVRALFLSLREREFVLASRTIGVPNGRIIFRHILPNATRPGHRRGDVRHGQRDPAGGGAQLPGPRRAAADAELGQHADRRPVADGAGVDALALDPAGHHDRPGRPLDQLHRRRPARRARPVPGAVSEGNENREEPQRRRERRGGKELAEKNRDLFPFFPPLRDLCVLCASAGSNGLTVGPTWIRRGNGSGTEASGAVRDDDGAATDSMRSGRRSWRRWARSAEPDGSRAFPDALNDEVDVYEIHYDSLDNLRVAGWYMRTKTSYLRRPIPALLTPPGLSPSRRCRSPGRNRLRGDRLAPRGEIALERRFNPGTLVARWRTHRPFTTMAIEAFTSMPPARWTSSEPTGD